MRQSILTLRNYKLIDLSWQVLAFFAMCIVISNPSTGPFGLYVMAAAQLISAISWPIYSYNHAVIRSRILLQNIFFGLSGFLVIAAVCQPGIFFTVSYLGMTWLGPILGTWYFVLTINEARRYKQMAQRLSLR